MKHVIFYSYRGGTGRTTLLANAAVALARMGERVCMLDCDFGAPGLARWRDLRPDFVDFSPTFNETLETLLGNASSDIAIRPFRVSSVRATLEEQPTLTVNIEPGSLWFLPPGRLSGDFLQAIRNGGWPPGSDGDSAVTEVLRRIIEQVKRELAPTVLIVDTSPGVAAGITGVMSALQQVDLVVFPTRLTLQAVEGFEVASSLGKVLGPVRDHVLPVATFVPPGAELTSDFQRRLAAVEKELDGARVEHVIPLIPELGISERILTAGWPEDTPASFAYWRVAETIAQHLQLASGAEAHARRIETEFAFAEAATAYRESYNKNTALATALLGTARCLLRTKRHSDEEQTATPDRAARLLGAFFASRGISLPNAFTVLCSTDRADVYTMVAAAIARPVFERADVVSRLRRSLRFGAMIGRIERDVLYAEATTVDASLVDAAEIFVRKIGPRTAVELVDLLLLLADAGASPHVPASLPVQSALPQPAVYLYPRDGRYAEKRLSDVLQHHEVVVVLPPSGPTVAAKQHVIEQLRQATRLGCDIENGCEYWLEPATIEQLEPRPIADLPPETLGRQARTLFAVDVVELTEKILRDILRHTSRLLGQRPNARVVIIPTRGTNGVQLHRWDRAGVYGVAPEPRVDYWLRHVAPNITARTSAFTAPSSDVGLPLTIVVEDQGPGRALRDVLEEEPVAALAARAEVWLTKLPAILDIVDEYDRAVKDDLATGTLPGYDDRRRERKPLDVLCVYQPRLGRLLSAARRKFDARIRPLRVLSLLTGYLVYRRDYFDDPRYRESYYRKWQRGVAYAKPLTVPRTYKDVLEKAAFFAHVLSEDGRDGHGLALQHSLRENEGADTQSDNALIALWHEWSMISRLLVGQSIRAGTLSNEELVERLDHESGDLFRDALDRFAILSAFAAPQSWWFTWDNARRSLIDGSVAMTITWSDSTPLFADLLARQDAQELMGYTLVNLDTTDPEFEHMPLAHIDGMVAVLMNPEREDTAERLFSIFDDLKIQAGFVERGASPPDLVTQELAEACYGSRFRIDARATRYGVPRAYNERLSRNELVRQARVIAGQLQRVAPKRKKKVAHICEFETEYDTLRREFTAARL